MPKSKAVIAVVTTRQSMTDCTIATVVESIRKRPDQTW